MKKLVVDKNKCIGCGTCLAFCPEVFELGEDGKAKIKESAEIEKLKKQIKEAIENCPVKAIDWK